MERLYEKLVHYSTEDYYPMHMPGHKRNTKLMSMVNPYALDITEIEGFDNLHQAEGVIKQLSERLVKLYGSKKAYPLVNGSTSGILAGISALTKRGDQVLIARNCHKSVYHAVAQKELHPIYFYPECVEATSIFGGILPRQTEELLIKHPGVKLVVITSPTYEGVVSDIKEIAEVVHRFGAKLMVDEAHGAHFGFHPGFPKSAVTLGADLVIQSLHKTLPAFTQTAVLHSNLEQVDHRIRKYLAVYQSSSPSYLLLAGLDRCVSLIEEKAAELFESYYERLTRFYEAMGNLRNLRLMNQGIIDSSGVYDFDLSKLTIIVRGSGINGHTIFRKLHSKYHIVMEMEAGDYVLGMTSICDTDEGFQRLADALIEIDKEINGTDSMLEVQRPELFIPEQVITPGKAMEKETDTLLLSDSRHRVSASFVSLFPPGAPILVPGERIDEAVLNYIDKASELGLTITGLIGQDKNRIEVIKEYDE